MSRVTSLRRGSGPDHPIPCSLTPSPSRASGRGATQTTDEAHMIATSRGFSTGHMVIYALWQLTIVCSVGPPWPTVPLTNKSIIANVRPPQGASLGIFLPQGTFGPRISTGSSLENGPKPINSQARRPLRANVKFPKFPHTENGQSAAAELGPEKCGDLALTTTALDLSRTAPGDTDKAVVEDSQLALVGQNRGS